MRKPKTYRVAGRTVVIELCAFGWLWRVHFGRGFASGYGTTLREARRVAAGAIGNCLLFAARR